MQPILKLNLEPDDDHVTRSGSQSVDEGAEDRHGHVGGEASAAVLGVRTLAQSHRGGAARWVRGRHAAAVVKHLGREISRGKKKLT